MLVCFNMPQSILCHLLCLENNINIDILLTDRFTDSDKLYLVMVIWWFGLRGES